MKLAEKTGRVVSKQPERRNRWLQFPMMQYTFSKDSTSHM